MTSTAASTSGGGGGSNIGGGLDILRQFRFSAVLEHQAASVRMSLNPVWKVQWIDPEEVEAPLSEMAEARRIVPASSFASASAAASASSTQKQNTSNINPHISGSSSGEGNQQQQSQNINNNTSLTMMGNQNQSPDSEEHKKNINVTDNINNNNNSENETDQIPKFCLVPFLSIHDETMAPRKGTSELLSGFSVGWAATIKRIKFFYSPLPPALAHMNNEDLAAKRISPQEHFERRRNKAWCKKCVSHVLQEDPRVVAIDGNKKLHRLRTKSMLSPQQRINLGGDRVTGGAFRFNIMFQKRGEMNPESHAVALCCCVNDRGYMILVECVSQNELEGYVNNILMKVWLSDARRFELGTEINSYSDCATSALQHQQSLFGDLAFTDNDAAISFRLPMHPMQLRPDHSPTVPPTKGSLCAVTLELTMYQKLLDALDEDEALSAGGRQRLINVVLFLEVEDLLKESGDTLASVFSGDKYSQHRHEQFAEVFKDVRPIGLPVSVPIGKRTGRSTTCTFSTHMGDTQALVKSSTVTTLVGSHGVAATYFTKLGQGMFDEYMYLYQHLLSTLHFFAEREISGTFSRYRSVPIRIVENDLATCYSSKYTTTDPSTRLNAMQQHSAALRASADGEIEGVASGDIIYCNDLAADGSARSDAVRANAKEEDSEKKKKSSAAAAAGNDEIVDETVDQQQKQHEEEKKKDDTNKEGGEGIVSLVSPDVDEGDEERSELDSLIDVSDIPRIQEIAKISAEEDDESRIDGRMTPHHAAAGQQQQQSPGGGKTSPSLPVLNQSSTTAAGGLKGEGKQQVDSGETGGESGTSETEQQQKGRKSGSGMPSDIPDVTSSSGGVGGQQQQGGEGNSNVALDQGSSQQHYAASTSVASTGGGGESITAAAATAASGGGGVQPSSKDAITAANLEEIQKQQQQQQTSSVGISTSRQAQQQTVEGDGEANQQNNIDVDATSVPGQPTAQQVSDLREALAAINAEEEEELLEQQEQQKLQLQQGGVDDSIGGVVSGGETTAAAGGGGKKQPGSSSHQSASTTLRNSYIELCKQEDCRPNSYLLQKLPIIPRVTQTIEQLDMSHNYVGHAGFVAILRLLALLPKVNTVYFNSMSLDNTDVKALCYELSKHQTIHSIFLRNNPRITLPAAKNFFRLLKENTNITTISLTGTGIGLQLQQRLEGEADFNKEHSASNKNASSNKNRGLTTTDQHHHDDNNTSASAAAHHESPGITITVVPTGEHHQQEQTATTTSPTSSGGNENKNQQEKEPSDNRSNASTTSASKQVVVNETETKQNHEASAISGAPILKDETMSEGSVVAAQQQKQLPKEIVEDLKNQPEDVVDPKKKAVEPKVASEVQEL